MALATQCPHCGTTFRVAADQLKLRGGIVRCGACQGIFDGNTALVDLVKAVPPRASSPPAVSAQPEVDEEPIFTLEFDRTFAPFGIIPQVSSGDGAAGGDAQEAPVAALPEAAAEAAPQPLAGAEPEVDSEAKPGDAASAEPLPEPEHVPEPEPLPQPEPEPVPESEPLPQPEPEPVPESEPLPQPLAAPANVPPVDFAPAPEPQVDEELVAAPLRDDAHDALDAGLDAALDAGLDDTAPASTGKTAVTFAAAASIPPLLLRESGPATVTMPSAPIAPPVAPHTTPRARAAEARAARRSKLTPTRIEAPKLRVPDTDEPEFVRRGRQREQSSKARRIAMIAGSLVLLLVLLAQAAYIFRDTLAARYPALKPMLVSACAMIGCRVALPARIEQLAVETGELSTLGGNAYTFTTQLRNSAEAAQAWPSLELTLSDADDKPLVRRVFGPRDYLPAGQPLAAGFAARTEQAIKLHFRVGEPAPSGYHIAVFYP